MFLSIESFCLFFQGRGISPSSIKHLRFLKRFLSRQSSASFETSRSSSPPPASQLMSTSLLTNHPTSPLRKILLTKQQQQQQQPHHVIIPQKAPGFSINRTIHIDGPSQGTTCQMFTKQFDFYFSCIDSSCHL